MNWLRKPEQLQGEPTGTSTITKRVPPGPTTVLGVDVSHFEPVVDWGKVKASGRVFAFAKTTDGTGSQDMLFGKHRASATAAGLVFGGYHFFRYHSGLTPPQQADLFMDTYGAVLPGELPPTLDVERSEGLEELGDHASAVLECLGRIEERSGMVPIIYTSASFFTGMAKPELFVRYPLWVANYHATAPLTPPPWNRWSFWQDSEATNIPGIGSGDSDIFNGAFECLKAMTKQ